MPIRARTLLWSIVVLLTTAQGVGAQPLTLDAALQTAFANNPDLAAAQWEIGIAEGARQQAGLIPNPVASWDAEDTRRSTRTTTVKLSQTLELGGKRSARIDVASRAQDAAALTLAQRRNALRADVIDNYYGALRAQERLDLAQRSMNVAERGLAVANGRVTAGKTSPVEATRAQVQLSEMRLELNRAQIGLTDAYRRLATSTGSAVTDFQAVAGQNQLTPALPPVAHLLARLEQTAELRLAELSILQNEASVGLEKAQRIPDLDVSIGSQYDASVRERVNLVGVSMPIPLFNRNQGNVLAATRRADQARDLRNAAELRLRTETRQALDLWQTANTEVRAFNQQILPAAQSAVDSATRGFEMGKFSFLDVLDAQRTLIAARTQYLTATAQATEAWVRIERIYGDLARF
ncbi:MULTISPECIES: TolC family protein [Pseudomonas]|jgi:cobalt-zinc-cadmium efflux system outer membrane protein|uniref:Cobalt-zinc-cadmium resistance protein CzcC n=1 Tax=Pseudomonas fluorescens TaxID=294 RepID=A0A5E7RMS7_PSEFL|nr:MULTISPECIES: TolC family protein [Pseudomonas]VVM14861.1 Cobalt-zinc-cadmium resistance protein CzcC [Pseudomonas fluorescens]AVJ36442.1 type I secretion protein TolC [Pseudomonas lurida]MBC3232848.1 TolC family protein [Pseudomonas lurida]MBC3239324.1 TolC family protein [Pseudomonas lurida]MBC8979032.1 TolC family protein [Pseudomonas lurida]